MPSRMQITLDPNLQAEGRDRAREMGVSFAEYIRRLVVRDLGGAHKGISPASVFDLGSSGGSDVARHKDAMIAEAISAKPRAWERRAKRRKA